jgi:hypothetical protein
MQREKTMFQHMASSVRLSLSDGLASASAPAVEVYSRPFSSISGSETDIRQEGNAGVVSQKEGESPLVVQVEALTPEAIRAGIAAPLSDVRTLPIDWAQNSLVQVRTETYLSFSLFLMKHTGAVVNSAFIAQQYHMAFQVAQSEQTGCSEETVSTNWISNHPLWLPVLWKQCTRDQHLRIQILRGSLEEALKPCLPGSTEC